MVPIIESTDLVHAWASFMALVYHGTLPSLRFAGVSLSTSWTGKYGLYIHYLYPYSLFHERERGAERSEGGESFKKRLLRRKTSRLKYSFRGFYLSTALTQLLPYLDPKRIAITLHRP